ncbi:uncharacterized protein RHO25_001566 [Cercospora beticola]|uniref:Uncharacterized protein n=1 Tax=Cercospora beticola TaxID=122368 RepID=A0ABZ0NBQ5_CERBT|nr:hypothetical protein RHO25_001566 [Cercospora beticola]
MPRAPASAAGAFTAVLENRHCGSIGGCGGSGKPNTRDSLLVLSAQRCMYLHDHQRLLLINDPPSPSRLFNNVIRVFQATLRSVVAHAPVTMPFLRDVGGAAMADTLVQSSASTVLARGSP